MERNSTAERKMGNGEESEQVEEREKQRLEWRTFRGKEGIREKGREPKVKTKQKRRCLRGRQKKEGPRREREKSLTK